MAPELAGLIGIIILILFIALGVPVAISMFSVSIVGIFYFLGFEASLELLYNSTYAGGASFIFAAVPMFLLMGYFAYYSGLISKAFDTASLWLSRLPGGLAMTTSVASGMFGATMGSGGAATAAMSRIAIPEMLRFGYDKSLATGTVAAAATIAVLIPPSIIMVVYASFSGISVGKMLLAGYLPAVLSIVIYLVMIGIRVRLNPKLAPPIFTERITWRRRFASLKDVWGITLLAIMVLGGLYGGIFTATETAAFGASGALFLLFISKRFSWSVMKESLSETLRMGVMIFLLVLGASMFSIFIALSDLPKMLTMFIVDAQLSALHVVIAFLVVDLVLGSMMNAMSIMLLTLPIALPVFNDLNVNLIWFGILFIKMAEIGAITPPFGIGVYIVKGVVGDTVPIGTIFRGIWWFVLMDLLTIIILVAIPQISLWLPSAMMK